ncbi:MAG: UDP-2,3-diacylglucosamine diphosphatase [Clostridium sp.]|nr:UDP-2,3-diacylglucosamine diphosphatase [Clostridium sp.]
MTDRKTPTAYFISDCHLGARYIDDRRAHEKRVVDWLGRIAADATELYLLGDIIDYWFEYRYVVPRGYTRFFGALASLADSGVKVTWLKGNHDIWLFDYLRDEIGLEVADGVIEREIGGGRFVMAHGDGIGCQSWYFSAMRSMFRNRFLQWLYAAIHPRWTVGLAHAWSSHNRMAGHPETADSLGENDRYVTFARDWTRRNGRADYFIFGHRHILVDQPGPAGSRIVVLGDGFRLFSYGRYASGRFETGYY